MTGDTIAYCLPIVFTVGLAWVTFELLCMCNDIRAAKREDESNYGSVVKHDKHRDRRP